MREIQLPHSVVRQHHTAACERFKGHDTNTWPSQWRTFAAAAHLAIHLHDPALYRLAILDMLAIARYRNSANSLAEAQQRLHEELGLLPRSNREVETMEFIVSVLWDAAHEV